MCICACYDYYCCCYFQFQVCPKSLCVSTPGHRTDLFQRDPKNVLITDFFGSVRKVEITTEKMSLQWDSRVVDSRYPCGYYLGSIFRRCSRGWGWWLWVVVFLRSLHVPHVHTRQVHGQKMSVWLGHVVRIGRWCSLQYSIGHCMIWGTEESWALHHRCHSAMFAVGTW